MSNDKYWKEVATKIADWLREYMRDAGKEGYVVGISGGVDSAVAARLAVMGVGHRKVLGLIIPTEFAQNSLMSSRVVNWLDIPYLYQPMGTVTNAMQNVMQIDLDRVAKGNIAARIRMVVLYAYANAKNYLVLGTGNRSELEVGYFTKYGDGGVDVLPLGNLLKTDVWDLARYLGAPESVIRQAPTAGLWKGQTDEEELGIDYKTLDHVLLKGDQADVPPEVWEKVQRLKAAGNHKLFMPETPPWLLHTTRLEAERLQLDPDNPADFRVEMRAKEE